MDGQWSRLVLLAGSVLRHSAPWLAIHQTTLKQAVPHFLAATNNHTPALGSTFLVDLVMSLAHLAVCFTFVDTHGHH